MYLFSPQLNPDGSRPACWLPDDIPYERWVRHIFDHRVYPDGDRWWWHRDDVDSTFEYWKPPTSDRAVEFMTRLFRNSSPLATEYTRAQIDQGLQLLIEEYIVFDLTKSGDPEVEAMMSAAPWPDRKACIESLFDFYRDLLAAVYGNDTAHNQTHPPDRPNFALYMWWDMISVGSNGPDADMENEALLSAFECVLAEVKAEACLESVLHGLNHWHLDIPEQVESTIDRFLDQRKDISEPLRAYAQLARWGGAM
jgi:hypothetical protein